MEGAVSGNHWKNATRSNGELDRLIRERSARGEPVTGLLQEKGNRRSARRTANARSSSSNLVDFWHQRSGECKPVREIEDELAKRGVDPIWDGYED